MINEINVGGVDHDIHDKRIGEGEVVKLVDLQTAVLGNNYNNLVKMTMTPDEKCLCVNSIRDNYSNVSLFNGEGTAAMFRSLMWFGTAVGGNGSVEITLYDGSNRNYDIIINNSLSGYIKKNSTSDTINFDASNLIHRNEWNKIYVDYLYQTVLLYINDTLVARLVDKFNTLNVTQIMIAASKELTGKLALSNIYYQAGSPGDVGAVLTEEDYFDLDNYTDIPTSDTSTGKKIIRGGDDVWSVDTTENFTGEGEYVVVNKKYLRKILENAGTGGGGKLYLHSMRIYYNESEIANFYDVYCSFYSTSGDAITTVDKIKTNAELIKNANIIKGYCNEMEYYKPAYIDYTGSNIKVYYFVSDNMQIGSYDYLNDTPNIIEDTVTEV